jgi:hypothetical protein
MIMVKVNQQGEIIFTLFGLFAESEVKTKLERFVRKRKELMVMGLSIMVNYYLAMTVLNSKTKEYTCG